MNEYTERIAFTAVRIEMTVMLQLIHRDSAVIGRKVVGVVQESARAAVKIDYCWYYMADGWLVFKEPILDPLFEAVYAIVVESSYDGSGGALSGVSYVGTYKEATSRIIAAVRAQDYKPEDEWKRLLAWREQPIREDEQDAAVKWLKDHALWLAARRLQEAHHAVRGTLVSDSL